MVVYEKIAGIINKKKNLSDLSKITLQDYILHYRESQATLEFFQLTERDVLDIHRFRGGVKPVWRH